MDEQTRREIDRLEKFVGTRASDKQLTAFTWLVRAIIGLLIGGGGISYLGYADLRTDLAVQTTRQEAIIDNQEKAAELLKDLITLMPQLPGGPP